MTRRFPEGLASVEEIVEAARNGRMFILVDDEDRENEGDLVIPAQMATPDAINFMARHGRGLICLSMTRSRIEELRLPMMSEDNGSRHQTAFTVSIEARHGVTTGISASDRARTVAAAINTSNGPEEIVSPGHVFPLMARDGGVLVRAGHTEAAVDIARLAGLYPAGVICEIMNEDGTMAKMPDVVAFATRHGLKVGTIRDLIAYRLRHDHLVHCIGQRQFESNHGGAWTVKVYGNSVDNSEILVLQKGQVSDTEPTLVRMHSISLFTDVFAEARAGPSLLHRAMDVIGKDDSGIIVLLRDVAPNFLSQLVVDRPPEGDRAIRDYGIGAQILADLDVHRMVLLTNSDHSMVGLQGYGLEIARRQKL